MKPEGWKQSDGRWTRVEQLYQAALERAASQRAGFLDEACAGDKALRREVEILLGYAESYMDRPPMKAPARALADDPGQSLVGRQLGSHQILSLLGAGGMGEVYRARDSKLRREVAIKVLPEAFAKDPERLARFRQEARLLASLNHPNIATIHGLEES
ncbi:MAG: protein kinase, partial [Acidobacteria bacterium]|nr:protein kinase [Acidobacteriota bacterium]